MCAPCLDGKPCQPICTLRRKLDGEGRFVDLLFARVCFFELHSGVDSKPAGICNRVGSCQRVGHADAIWISQKLRTVDLRLGSFFFGEWYLDVSLPWVRAPRYAVYGRFWCVDGSIGYLVSSRNEASGEDRQKRLTVTGAA